MIAHVKQPLLSLAGLRILVPRGGNLGTALHDKIRLRGGVPTIAPLIDTAPPSDPAAFAQAVERWNAGEYGWIVVTSATAALALEAAGAAPRPHSKTAAVGPVTAAAMQALGFPLHVMPGRDYSGNGLVASLIAALPAPAPVTEVEPETDGETADPAGMVRVRPLSPGAPGAHGARTTPGAQGARNATRILLPVSELADDTVERGLVEVGYRVDRVGAYTTVRTPEIAGLRDSVAAGEFDVVLATSGSAARAIAARLAPLPATTLIVAIGQPTARALAAAGLEAAAIAETSTTDGLLDAVSVALVAGSRELYEHSHKPYEQNHQGEAR